MKFIMMLWILTAGAGVSYAVYEERNNRIRVLKEMEQSLGKLRYFMYEWRMPFEEALTQILKESFPTFHTFYESVLSEVLKRECVNIGELWGEKSNDFLQGVSLHKQIRELWASCFTNIPMEPEALNNALEYKRAQLQAYLSDLQDKYKTEKKLVWTLGLFTSTFLCLIIW